MKTTEIINLDEVSTDTLTSTNPRGAAGSVPQAVANLKARRLAQQQKTQQTAQTPAPAQPATAQQPAPAPAQPAAAQQPVGQPQSGPSAPPKKAGFFSSMMRGMGANQAADTIDTYNQTKAQGADLSQEPAADEQPPAPPVPSAQPAAGEQPPVPSAQPAAGEQPPANTGAGKNPLFKDPQAFKSAWDQYVASKTKPDSPYQLISDPEMLTVLKTMWMRSGGTQATGNQLPKTTNDKFGNPVAPAPAPTKPTTRQKYFNESKKIKRKLAK